MLFEFKPSTASAFFYKLKPLQAFRDVNRDVRFDFRFVQSESVFRYRIDNPHIVTSHLQTHLLTVAARILSTILLCCQLVSLHGKLPSVGFVPQSLAWRRFANTVPRNESTVISIHQFSQKFQFNSTRSFAISRREAYSTKQLL